MAKSVEEYMKLPYTVQIARREEEDGAPYWLATVKELPGLMTDADSLEELERMVAEAMSGWFEACLELGLPIPEPEPPVDSSGKFLVRTPKSLHRKLAEAAARDGVSLNAWVNAALAEAVGMRQAAGNRGIEGNGGINCS